MMCTGTRDGITSHTCGALGLIAKKPSTFVASNTTCVDHTHTACTAVPPGRHHRTCSQFTMLPGVLTDTCGLFMPSLRHPGTASCLPGGSYPGHHQHPVQPTNKARRNCCITSVTHPQPYSLQLQMLPHLHQINSIAGAAATVRCHTDHEAPYTLTPLEHMAIR